MLKAKSRFLNTIAEKYEYHDVLTRITSLVQSRLNDPNRFQPMSDRKDTSLMPLDVIKAIFNYKYAIQHKGCSVLKGHEDLLIGHQLLSHVKPATVIELGAFNGGAALWIADTLNTLDVQSSVYSMDIDLTLLDEKAKKFAPSNLQFVHGDTSALEKTFPSSFMSACARPLVIIEDSHNNFLNVLEYFHPFLKTGDYWIVEDTNPRLPTEFGPGVLYDVPYEAAGCEYKLNDLKKFMIEHESSYAVDSFFTDFLGYNVTHNWHGYIRRM